MPKINLGFMTAELGPHDTANKVKAILDGVKALEDIKCRTTVLLSGVRKGDCVDFSPLASLSLPVEIIAIQERTSTSVERHRLLGAGFLEQADLVLVADLDLGHNPNSIIQLVKLGLDHRSSLLIPQADESTEESRTFSIGELTRAFLNYVTVQACGRTFKDKNGRPYPNLEVGLLLFRAEAIKNLMRRPWIWQCSVWDLEVAYFALCGHDSESLAVEFPHLPLTMTKPVFDVRETVKKLEIIARLSGQLTNDTIKNLFEDFIKKYSHLLNVDVVDSFREQVVK